MTQSTHTLSGLAVAATAQRTVRVALVDDHTVFREATKALLTADSEVAVVAEAADAADGYTSIAREQPDVALIDIRLGESTSLELIRRLSREFPRIKILVLTAFDYQQYVREMMKAGAKGYLLKEASGAELLKAIRDLHHGDAAFSPRIGATLLDLFAHPDPEPAFEGQELTSREIEVLRLVQQGVTNREIAERLGVSKKTVDTHVSHILLKLGVSDRVQAVTTATHKGLLR